MDDRQLLEDAARAAGHSYPWYEAHGGQMHAWNPLDDDGDALRLAVRLGLGVIQWQFGVSATHTRSNREFSEQYGDCQFVATRRAIVRAAAAIGRQMREADHSPDQRPDTKSIRSKQMLDAMKTADPVCPAGDTKP